MFASDKFIKFMSNQTTHLKLRFNNFLQLIYTFRQKNSKTPIRDRFLYGNKLTTTTILPGRVGLLD